MLLIKKNDAQRILNYLVLHPFNEVAELVNIMVNLPQGVPAPGPSLTDLPLPGEPCRKTDK